MKIEGLIIAILFFSTCVSVSAQDTRGQSSSKPSERMDKDQVKIDETITSERQQSGHDMFQMPEEEQLRGCSYSEGYAFPDLCRDEKGNVIFDLMKDDQRVLDKIIQKQGKQGKYNKIEDGIWVRRKPGHSVPEESIDVTGLAPADAERKAALEAHGYEYHPPEPGETDYVEEYFVLPESEALVGCMYTIGYSYPDLCFEDKKVIFDAAKHDQKVLDQIIKKQNKQGKYNKLPGGGPVKCEVEGIELPNYDNMK